MLRISVSDGTGESGGACASASVRAKIILAAKTKALRGVMMLLNAQLYPIIALRRITRRAAPLSGLDLVALGLVDGGMLGRLSYD
jgi:hypothetical protein